jgi:1,4-alpha-glucan branching enzyme
MKTTSKKPKPSRPRAKGSNRAVHFEYRDPTATMVCLAGTFNDWHPTASEMVRMEDGRWLKELTLPPGRYEYRLVVDGVWMPDPACPISAPNSYGGENSVLTVPAGSAP